MSEPLDAAWPGLTDTEWDNIKFAIPRWQKPPRTRKYKRQGARPWASDKKAFEALLWNLAGLGYLERLPARFGSRRTACRRLKLWFRTGTLDRLWENYMRKADRTAQVEWGERLAAMPRRNPIWQKMLAAFHRNEFGDFPRA